MSLEIEKNERELKPYCLFKNKINLSNQSIKEIFLCFQIEQNFDINFEGDLRNQSQILNLEAKADFKKEYISKANYICIKLLEK